MIYDVSNAYKAKNIKYHIPHIEILGTGLTGIESLPDDSLLQSPHKSRAVLSSSEQLALYPRFHLQVPYVLLGQ